MTVWGSMLRRRIMPASSRESGSIASMRCRAWRNVVLQLLLSDHWLAKTAVHKNAVETQRAQSRRAAPHNSFSCVCQRFPKPNLATSRGTFSGTLRRCKDCHWGAYCRPPPVGRIGCLRRQETAPNWKGDARGSLPAPASVLVHHHPEGKAVKS